MDWEALSPKLNIISDLPNSESLVNLIIDKEKHKIDVKPPKSINQQEWDSFQKSWE